MYYVAIATTYVLLYYVRICTLIIAYLRTITFILNITQHNISATDGDIGKV